MKLNSLILTSSTSQEIVALAKEWRKGLADTCSPEVVSNHEVVTRHLYSRLDNLSNESIQEFRDLLCVEDLTFPDDDERAKYSTGLLFVWYLSENVERENLFLNGCNEVQLEVYFARMCWYFKSGHFHNKEAQERIRLFADMMQYLCDVFKQRSQISENTADKIAIRLIKTLVAQHDQLYPLNDNKTIKKNNKIAHRIIIMRQIAGLIKNVHNVNINNEPDVCGLLELILRLNDGANACPELLKNWAYWLVDQGIKINYQQMSFMSNFRHELCNNQYETAEFIIYALNKNPQTATAIIMAQLRSSIEFGRTGSIVGLFDILNKRDPNWSEEKVYFREFLDLLLANSYRVDFSTIWGASIYLAINDKTISDLLEYVAINHGYEKLIIVTKNIFGMNSKYQHDNPGKWFEYERKDNMKGVMHYYANNPEACKELGLYFSKTPAIPELFIKTNPKICPLTIAVNKQNVAFMVFILRTMEFKVDRRLAAKIMRGVQLWLDAGLKLPGLIELLKQSIGKYRLQPLSWISFEYKLLKAIKAGLNDKAAGKQPLSRTKNQTLKNNTGLSFIANGASAANEKDKFSASLTPLIGLGKAIATEMTESRTERLDLNLS